MEELKTDTAEALPTPCVEKWNPIPEDIRGIPLMELAWRDCLLWAVGFNPIKEQFAAEAGGPLRIGRGGIVGMVDEATGFKAAEIRRFIEWFNQNVWGSMECDVDEQGPPADETPHAG